MKIIIVFILIFQGLLFADDRQTSITDEASFRLFCREAAQNESVFATFKQHPELVRVMQHVSVMQGQELIKHVIYHYPYLQRYFDLFRENDAPGAPFVSQYGTHGVFSPTTLRYIKIAGDVTHLFDDLGGKRIIEIGGGYGGQCKVLSDLYDFQEYILVDLPEVLALAKRYLETLGVQNVTYLTPEELKEGKEYDLVISNYAFSECRRSVQHDYLEKVVGCSKRGYLTCNQIVGYFTEPPYSPQELSAELEKFNLLPTILPENPRTAEGNFLIVWNTEE